MTTPKDEPQKQQVIQLSGEGKYDDWAGRVLNETNARAAVVLVLDGINGSGMAMTEEFDVAVTGISMALRLPKILRHIADHIEKQTEPLIITGEPN